MTEPQDNGTLSGSEEDLFVEARHWPFWLWLFVIFLAASLAFAVWAAVGLSAAIGILTVEIALLLAADYKSALEIRVTREWLFVGPASIERKFISDITALNANQTRLLRGPDQNPAAFLALRFWIRNGVKITINDDRDPTPYWLVSSHKSEEFTRSLYKPL